MIYLDYSATTPLDPSVFQAMKHFFTKVFANPASVHTPGQQALKAVDDARYHIAQLLQVTGNDLIFTSGATEANNLILTGVLPPQRKKAHIITTSIEHASILEPCHHLEKRGAKVTYLKVNHHGLVNPTDVISALRPETCLVSIGYVNSEVGMIQPIKKIGRLLSKYNQQRYQTWLNTSPRQRGPKPQPVLFHTDATQAPNFLSCDVPGLHVDALSLSGHKLYGPKGIGLLYCRHDISLQPLLYGGHQERNLRSGTVNVPGVVGLAAALEKVSRERKKRVQQIEKLRQQLLTILRKALPEMIVNTPLAESTPSHLNLSFPGLEGDLLQAALDEVGIAVSTGSACASGDIEASHVLQAMGKSEAVARGAIRLTLGVYTTSSEIKTVGRLLPQVVKKLKNQATRHST